MTKRRGVGLLAAGLLLAGAWAMAPALAQTADVGTLTDRLDRLERSLTDLEQYIYRGGAPAAPGTPAGAAADRSDAVARMELRLTDFDRELKELTGKVEKVGFDIDRLRKRLEKLVADVDFRLTGLEHAQKELAARLEEQAVAAATPPVPALDTGDVPSGEPQDLGALASGDLVPETSGAAETQPVLGPALPPGAPQQQYEYAFSLLRQADYGEAERALATFIELHPEHALTSNAYYWLGETHYVRNNFEQAAVIFLKGFKVFPRGSKAPDNLLKLGMTLTNLGKETDACKTLEKLDAEFPDASTPIKEQAAVERQRAGCG
ncbi:MAG: tol-pal system protein YbgF [Alphaproteobacteria bacterium]